MTQPPLDSFVCLYCGAASPGEAWGIEVYGDNPQRDSTRICPACGRPHIVEEQPRRIEPGPPDG